MTHGAVVYPAPAGGLRDKLHGAFLIPADGAGAAGSRDVLDEAVVQGGGASATDTRDGAVIHPAPGGGGPDASVAMAGDGRRHGGVCSPCLYDMLCTVKNARHRHRLEKTGLDRRWDIHMSLTFKWECGW